MSARNSFRSVFMVASCATAALGCYLVSLRVASERAALEDVETKIVMAQRDVRVLQTEIGTRGRLAQLERWNVKVLALSAPSADQFAANGFELARMVTPQRKIDLEAPVVLASAPAPASKPQIEAAPEEAEQSGPTPQQLMHVVSLPRSVPAPEPKPEAKPKAPVKLAAKSDTPKAKLADKAAKPSVVKIAEAKSLAKPVKPAVVKAKSEAPAKVAAVPAAKPKKLAAATTAKAPVKKP